MNQPTIKICGITRLEDAEAAIDSGADYIGLIRADSPRAAPLETARELASRVRGRIVPVLLFRNAPIEQVIADLRACAIDHVQLHGDEPPAFVERLRLALPDCRVIRAFPVTDSSGDEILRWLDLPTAPRRAIAAVILDHPKSGLPADEPAFRAVAALLRAHGYPVWRAGGLAPDNVVAIADRYEYDGYDIARGVEDSPGIKSHDLIRAFIANVRRAHRDE